MKSENGMTWGAFKAMIEAQGATDESLVGYADMDFGGLDDLLDSADSFRVEEIEGKGRVVLLRSLPQDPCY